MAITDYNLGDIKCPNCGDDKSVLCPECGESPEDCSCVDKNFLEEVEEAFCMACELTFLQIPPEYVKELPLGTIYNPSQPKIECTCDPPQLFFCGKCRVSRSYLTGPWKSLDDAMPKKRKKRTLSSWKGSNGGTFYSKCRHYHVKTDLGNGVFIYPSSSNSSRTNGDSTAPTPDFGLYADTCWKPTWRNEFILWPDMSLPTNKETTAEQIKDAYLRAKNGEVVEIGCIGGHGRTGTILACMYVYASWDNKDPIPLSPEDAIKKVHSDYCKEAVETKTQEWFVAWFSNHFFGTTLPEEPQNSHSSSSTTYSTGYAGQDSWESFCTPSEHYKMIEAGNTECSKNGKGCKYWNEDKKNFAKEKTLAAPSPAPVKSCTVTEHFAMWANGDKACTEKQHCEHWNIDFANFSKGILVGVNLHMLGAVSDYINKDSSGTLINPYAKIPDGASTMNGLWTPEKRKEWISMYESGEV